MFIISPLMPLVLEGTEKGRGPETSSTHPKRTWENATLGKKKSSACTPASLRERCNRGGFSVTAQLRRHFGSRPHGLILQESSKICLLVEEVVGRRRSSEWFMYQILLDFLKPD